MSKQQYRNDNFKIVTEIQKFDISIYQIFKACDKRLRQTVLARICDMSEELLYMTDRANRKFESGSAERIKSQKATIELAERVDLFIPIVCKVCQAGTDNESDLRLRMSRIRDMLNNWLTSDIKKQNDRLRNRYMKLQQEYFKNEKVIHKIAEICRKKEIPNPERYMEAGSEALSKRRYLTAEIEKVKAEFDRSTKELDERTRSDNYTLLDQVIKELRKAGEDI